MAKKEKKDVVKAMFTCPVCGSHDMEEVSRINEVVAVMHSATIDEYGDVDVEFGEANMADAEIIDCYWRCSDCQASVGSEHFKPKGSRGKRRHTTRP